jgi:hypothetical protein
MTDSVLIDLLLHISEKLDVESDLSERVAGRMAFWAMQEDPRQRLNRAVSQSAAWKTRADRLEARALVRDAQTLQTLLLAGMSA